MEIFQYTFKLAGINAPSFIWIVSAVIVIFTILQIARMWLLFRGANRAVKRAVLGILLKSENVEGEHQIIEGVSEILGADAVRFAGWKRFKGQLVRMKSVAHDDEGYFAAADPGECFTVQSLLSRGKPDSFKIKFTNLDFFQAIPSILTGVGLLATFLAILVALIEVKILTNGQVDGLRPLISGLSGKFLSSVVALLCATVFVFFEKALVHRFRSSRERLLGVLGGLFPPLSPSVALVNINGTLISEFKKLNDLTSNLAELLDDQKAAAQDFYSQLAPTLQKTIGESMNPRFNELINSIDALTEKINSSVSGSLDAVLGELKKSLAESLGNLGSNFQKGLSEGALNQVNGVAENLQKTSEILAAMNTQFEGTVTAFKGMIEQSGETASEQLARNQQQMQVLVESTGKLMEDLSRRLSDMGGQIEHNARVGTEAGVRTAQRLIEETGRFTQGTRAEFEKVVTASLGQLEKMNETATLLDETVDNLSVASSTFRAFSKNAETSVKGLEVAAESIARAATTITSSHEAMEKLSEEAADQMEQLLASHENQQAVWNGIKSSMEHYQEIFKDVEGETEKLLQRITDNLTLYQQMCDKGFRDLAKVSDEHFTNATKKLGESVDELDERLQDLGETMDRIKQIAEGRR